MRGDSRRRTSRAAIAMIAAVLALPGTAEALPGAVDNWQDAQSLTPNIRLVTNPQGFTVQGGEPFTTETSWCGQSGTDTRMGSTMWWYVTGTGGDITLSTEHSTVDSLLAIYPANGTMPSAAAALGGCWDDNVGNRNAHVRVTNTIAGARYLVQTGRCGTFWNGAWATCASPAGLLSISAVTNDQRAFAAPAEAGAHSNVGATVETGEPAQCGGRGYGATVWFRWTAPAAGTVTVRASRFDTTLALFRGSDPQAVACSDDPRPERALSEELSQAVTPGEYFIQVGGKDGGDNFDFGVAFEEDLDLDKDGSRRPEDCDDGNAAIRPGKPDIAHNGVDEDCAGGDNKDQDGDHHAARFAGGDDCNDKNLHINPGVADKPNNGIDEDCKNGDKPARLPTSPQISFLNNPVSTGGRIFGTMRVRNLRKGYTVGVRCKGSPQCPERLKAKVRKGSSKTFPQYYGRILGAGAKVEIRVTTKGNVLGFLKRYSVRRRGNPRQTACELLPRSGKAVRCRRG